MSAPITKHSPTPWRVEKFNDTKSWSIYAAGGTKSLASVKSEADANLIVRAVNALAEREASQ